LIWSILFIYAVDCVAYWANGPQAVRGLQLSYVEIKQIQCEINKYVHFIVAVIVLLLSFL